MRNFFLGFLLISVSVHASESKKTAVKRVKVERKANWIIHPTGQCVKAEGGMSLVSVMEKNPGCVLSDDQDLLKGLSLLDCSNSELGVKLMFADTLAICKKAISQAKAAGQM